MRRIYLALFIVSLFATNANAQFGVTATRAAWEAAHPKAGASSKTISRPAATYVAGSRIEAPCPATNVPYFERFDAPTVASALPTCITVENVNGGNTWRTVTNLPSGDDPASYHNLMRLDYETDGVTPANDWFFTQGLNLTGGTSYRLRFHYRNSDGSTYVENLEVKYGTSNSAVSMTSGTLFSHTGINSNVWKDTLVDFIPSVSGVYYVGFHGFSAANKAFLCIDDVSVIATPACNAPVDVQLNSITGSSAVVMFNSPGGTSFYVEYGPLGFTPGTGAAAGSGTVVAASASPVTSMMFTLDGIVVAASARTRFLDPLLLARAMMMRQVRSHYHWELVVQVQSIRMLMQAPAQARYIPLVQVQ